MNKNNIYIYIAFDYHHSSGRCAPRLEYSPLEGFLGQKARTSGNVRLRIFLPRKVDGWMGGHEDGGMERQT